MTYRFPVCTLCSLAAVAVVHVSAEAQVTVADSVAPAPFVFLDCNARNCDFDHFRREIGWVNWVRDREDAVVHVLVTGQQTGGGGTRYQIDYIHRSVPDRTKSLSYTSDPNDTDSEVRDLLTQTLGVGLVPFVENTAVGARLRVVYDAPETVANDTQEENDPWDLWVFRLSANGSLEGESQERQYSLRGSASADRVSENVKINFELSGEYDREVFELDDGETTSTSEDHAADLLMVWSVNEHWSMGGRVNVNRSTFLNRDIGFAIGPTVEFNIFPYNESTRRSLTFRYSLEAVAFKYEEVTVEGKSEELLPRHILLLATALQQPWGEIRGSVEGIQYLHDPAAHRINTSVNIEYRLFRGFNLDIEASVNRIKDQFFLSAAELSQEDIFLRRRQRETDFRFDLSVGFSYRFGSKFANIVNPRMGGRRGGRGFN